METFISRQQPVLDEIIAHAAKDYYHLNQSKPIFHFDVMESSREQWLLSDKEKKTSATIDLQLASLTPNGITVKGSIPF